MLYRATSRQDASQATGRAAIRGLPRAPRAATRQRGVTLIELMVGLSVLVILTTIGIPSMQSLLHNNRVAVLANDLTAALTLARSEAVRRGDPVQVCASDDGAACGGDWADGWIVVPTGGGRPIQVWQARWSDLGPTLTDPDQTIVFDGLGASRDGGVGFVIGAAPGKALRARLLDLNPAGRLALKTWCDGA